jgi:hypothetical protein
MEDAMVGKAGCIAAVMFMRVVVSAEQYGQFVGQVVASWDKGGRTMTLREPFGYVDPEGERWEAPEGSKVDGASIPRFAWSIIGGPFEGEYRDASVIHDVACVKKTRHWAEVHRMFYTAMLTAGVSPTKAKIMYAAVYHFGPRWPTLECPPGTACARPTLVFPPARTLTEERFAQLEKQISRRESASAGAGAEAPMSLEEIDRFVAK